MKTRSLNHKVRCWEGMNGNMVAHGYGFYNIANHDIWIRSFWIDIK